MASSCPVVVDPAGTDVHAEAASIRAGGPVSQVGLELPVYLALPPVGA